MTNTLLNYFDVKITKKNTSSSHFDSSYPETFKTSKPDIIVYTDGACTGNGKKNAKAGIGVYFGENDPRNVSKRITGKQTNNTAELKAVITAINILKEEIKLNKNILIFTDSKYVILCCTSYGQKQDVIGWKKQIKNYNLVKKIYEYFKNNKNIKIKHIRAHTGLKDEHSKGNDMADKLAVLSLGIEPKDKVSKIYLNVPFSDKDKVKKMGAKWDFKKKKWFIFENNKYKDDLVKNY